MNELGVKPRKANLWTAPSIRDITTNEIYKGFVRWNKRKQEKKMVDGNISVSRPSNKDYLLFKGLHEPIIDEKTFNKAQAIINTRKTPRLTKFQTLKNPLSGLIKCKKCGYYMQRKPDGRGTFLYCHITGCETRSIKLEVVEKEIVESLKKYLNKKNIVLTKESKKENNVFLNKDIIDKEIEKAKTQLERIYESYESGIYDSNVFVKRKNMIEEKLDQLNTKKEELVKTDIMTPEELKTNVIHLKDMLYKYYDIINVEEKNKLLKSLVVEVIYTRDKTQNDFDLEIVTKI